MAKAADQSERWLAGVRPPATTGDWGYRRRCRQGKIQFNGFNGRLSRLENMLTRHLSVTVATAYHVLIFIENFTTAGSLPPLRPSQPWPPRSTYTALETTELNRLFVNCDFVGLTCYCYSENECYGMQSDDALLWSNANSGYLLTYLLKPPNETHEIDCVRSTIEIHIMCAHSLVYSFLRAFVRSFTYSFIYSFLYNLIVSWFTCSFVNLLVRSHESPQDTHIIRRLKED